MGYVPLVTPTSQIVGSQAVINVVSSSRYKIISNETRGLLRGEYGAAPYPFEPELLKRALNGAEPITCRPADLLQPELEKHTTELQQAALNKGFRLAVGEHEVDDVLTYIMFPQVGLKFLEMRPPLKFITTVKKVSPSRIQPDFTTQRGWPLQHHRGESGHVSS